MVTSRRPGASPEATQVPPFLTKTYEMVEDQTTNDAVSWNPDGSGFIVWKPAEFARDMLPKHFKHNNFSSFVRQLNTYGFRKVDPDRWEFANDSFQKGRQDLLKRIHRRKAVSQAVPQQSSTSLLAPNAAIEIGQYGGLKDDVDALIRDKNVLTIELVRLRQQQQWSEQEIRRLSRRLEGAENRQMDMMHLFTKFLQNPSLLSQMFSVANRQKLDRPSGQRKRRARESDQDIEMGETGDDNQIVQYFPHSTPLDGDFAEDLVSLIDNLADSAAHRRLRDSQPEAGRDVDGAEQGSMGDALSDRNGEVAPDLHGVPKVEDPAPVMGIPVFPEGMSASDYLNQVGSLPLPVPSFNDSLPPEPSTSQPLGHHQRPSPFSVGNPGPTPIMSPLDPSMEPGTQGENDEYPVMDDLINGLEGLNSADMIMMDNQLPSDDSMQRDDSFWRQLFLHTGHDKQSPTQDIGTKFDSERVA